MEDFIESKGHDVSAVANLTEDLPKYQSILEIFNKSLDDSGISKYLETTDQSNIEDSQVFLGNLFKEKESIINENWIQNQLIHSKITDLNDALVYVDCLIDIENRTFQSRIFPRSLFESLNKLNIGEAVLIKIKTKPGSIRIDVFPGEGIVDLKLFDSKIDWEKLRGKNLDSKLTEW